MTKSNAAEVTQTVTSGRSVVPFTGGVIMFIYAFFWPDSYGHWLGGIVHAFRVASGI